MADEHQAPNQAAPQAPTPQQQAPPAPAPTPEQPPARPSLLDNLQQQAQPAQRGPAPTATAPPPAAAPGAADHPAEPAPSSGETAGGTTTPEEHATFLDAVREAGFSIQDGETEQDVQFRVVQALRQQAEQQQEIRRQLEETRQLAELYRRQADPQAGQVQQANGTHESRDILDIPWDEQLLRDANRYATQTEDGVRWDEKTPPEVKQRYVAAQAAQDRFLNEFSVNPKGTLTPFIEQLIEQRFNDLYGRKQAQQTEETTLESFRRENGEWLFEKDARTNQPAREASGDFKFSERGRRFAGYFQQAADMGVQGVKAQLEYAQRLDELDRLREGARANGHSSQAAEQAQQRRAEQLARGGAYTPDRGGSFPSQRQEPTPTPQNPRQSAGEKLLQNLRAGAGVG